MIAVLLALAPSALLVLWLRRLGMLPGGGHTAKALLAGALAVARDGGGAFALAVLVGIGFGAVEDALYVATGTG